MDNAKNSQNYREGGARCSGRPQALLLLAVLLACGKKPPPEPSPSAPAAPAAAGGTSGVGGCDCSACGEPAELAEDTEAAFVRDDPCTGVASDHTSVIGVISRRRGPNVVYVLHCDDFGWCFVRVPGGPSVVHGFVHRSVLRLELPTDPAGPDND